MQDLTAIIVIVFKNNIKHTLFCLCLCVLVSCVRNTANMKIEHKFALVRSVDEYKNPKEVKTIILHANADLCDRFNLIARSLDEYAALDNMVIKKTDSIIIYDKKYFKYMYYSKVGSNFYSYIVDQSNNVYSFYISSRRCWLLVEKDEKNILKETSRLLVETNLIDDKRLLPLPPYNDTLSIELWGN